MVPAGTPRNIIDRLQQGFAQILQAPAFRDERRQWQRDVSRVSGY